MGASLADRPPRRKPAPFANLPTQVYPAVQITVMSLLRLKDYPATWAVAGFAIGLGLGVNSASVWLIAVALGAFILNLRLNGPAEWKTEGRLFSGGAALMLSWLVGFVVHGIAFV